MGALGGGRVKGKRYECGDYLSAGGGDQFVQVQHLSKLKGQKKGGELSPPD